MPAIVTFIGWHNSGKTTVASKVVAELIRRGRKIAVVKSTSKNRLSFDHSGTDSDIYRQTGVDVLVAGPEEFVLQCSAEKRSLTELACRYFDDMELVIGEGFKQEKKIAKIEVFRNSGPRLIDLVDGVVAVVGDSRLVAGPVPVFSPDDVKNIADFLVFVIEKTVNNKMAKI